MHLLACSHAHINCGQMPIFEHLRRVGLEQLTPWFEAHNIQSRDQLGGLAPETPKKWCWELSRDDGRCFQQLKRLLSNDVQMQQHDYQTANIATIRSAFLAAYPLDALGEWVSDLRSSQGPVGEGGGKTKSATVSVGAGARTSERAYLLRNNRGLLDESGGLCRGPACGEDGGDVPAPAVPLLKRSRSVEAMATIGRLSELSQRLIDALTISGKVRVSLWQLRFLLVQHDDPEDLIAAAHEMADPRPPGRHQPVPITTATWFKRAGLHEYAAVFEDDGMNLASQVVDKIKKLETLRETAPDMSGDEQALLMKLIENKPEHGSDTVGVTCPDKSSVCKMFWDTYGGQKAEGQPGGPQVVFEAAVEFARRVSSKVGRSLVSSIELSEHFERHPGNDWRGALDAWETELVSPPPTPAPQPKPPSPPPACWVYKALRAAAGDFGSISNALLANGIESRDDLLCQPAFTADELKAVGLNKLGEARRLTRLIDALRSGVLDDGIPVVGDVLECPLFGECTVVSFREEDDMYGLLTKFGGTIWCSDAEGKVAPSKEAPTNVADGAGGGGSSSRDVWARMKNT